MTLKPEKLVRNVTRTMLLPCGTCIGCRKSKSQAWALRCLLELQLHDHATFTTLTYDPDHEPLTLSKRDLALFHKRLRRRATRPIRQFASGEYGETNGRPHYHDILFGCDARMDSQTIQEAWGMGHAYTVAVTPAAIGYTAGYCAKKYNSHGGLYHERIDYETGEVYNWQPEFLQMSRGGRNGEGIGGHARKHTASWKDFAILNGSRIPVPPYLHKAWEKIATEGQQEEHEHEKYLRTLTRDRITEYKLNAEEQIATAQQKLQSARRRL